MKLKMCTTGKLSGKICLKAVRDFLHQYVVCNQGRDGVKHEGKGENSIFWWGGSEPSQVPPLVANPNLLQTNTLRGVLGLITVIILKRIKEKEYFLSK